MPLTRRLSILAPLALLVAAACARGEAPAPASIAGTPAHAATPAALAATATAATSTVQPATTARPAAAVADCTPTATLTSASTEGPYYKAGSPERANLVDAGMAGTRLVITGTVRTADCKPVARAWLDFWQADAAGAYDNAGYRLRGHLFTDTEGRYRLETMAPGEYPGRTPHIHVKAQAPGSPVLTAQLYLPDAAANARDSIFQRQMVLRDVQTSSGAMIGRFDFVVSAR